MARTDVADIVHRLLEESGSFTTSQVAGRAGISRQAAHRHLAGMVARRELARTGAGRGARYQRAPAARVGHTFRTAGLDESEVWAAVRDEVTAGSTRAEAEQVLQYAFTELLNNAIDHSGSETVDVSIDSRGSRSCFELHDHGIGVFQKVRTALALDSDLATLQELSKGKVTTDPSRHSGEGLFFTSKAADYFELESGQICWVVDNVLPDVAVRDVPMRAGTRARVEVERQRTDRLEDLFARYTLDYQFVRTRMVVSLFAIGTRFVSRSEARRLLHGLEKFREVVLDFARVEGVGQGFVDEVFRVWANAHPATRLLPENMGLAVEFMVRRGLAATPSEGT